MSYSKFLTLLDTRYECEYRAALSHGYVTENSLQSRLNKQTLATFFSQNSRFFDESEHLFHPVPDYAFITFDNKGHVTVILEWHFFEVLDPSDTYTYQEYFEEDKQNVEKLLAAEITDYFNLTKKCTVRILFRTFTSSLAIDAITYKSI